jgi:hypothetical protein
MSTPIHYATGLPMKPCPTCGRLSGLTGIDGKDCLACVTGYDDGDCEADRESSTRGKGQA